MIHYIVNEIHTYITVWPIIVYWLYLNKNAWTNPITYKDKCIAMNFPHDYDTHDLQKRTIHSAESSLVTFDRHYLWFVTLGDHRSSRFTFVYFNSLGKTKLTGDYEWKLLLNIRSSNHQTNFTTIINHTQLCIPNYDNNRTLLPILFNFYDCVFAFLWH